METFVARQPIFDRRKDVYGYELFFRSGADQTSYDAIDGTAATRQVVANTLFSLGLDRVLCGKRAFVNFDETLIKEDLHQTFSKDGLVIELLETVRVDDSVIAACTQLHQSGFSLALDDFVIGSDAEILLPFANIIKVDIRTTPRDKQEALLRNHRCEHLAFLAEKVETYEEYEWTRACGYDFFQGHFFEKPGTISGRDVPSVKLACLQLLREVTAPEIDCKRTATVIERDVGLSFKLLSYVNSALFGLRKRVDSIDHAVALLGPAGLRPWAAVAAIPALAADNPPELAVKALVRAQFCDRMAKLLGIHEDGAAFLIGLFSHLDAMLNMPLREAVSQAGLSDRLAAVLLEEDTDLFNLQRLYGLMRSYEAADWNAVVEMGSGLNLDLDSIAGTYRESTFWTAQALNCTNRRKDSRSKRRHAHGGRIRILCEDGNGRERMVNAVIQNISEMGMQLRVNEKIAPRTTVLCNDAVLKLSGRGVVRYCNFSQGRYLVGVDFSGGTGWRDPMERRTAL